MKLRYCTECAHTLSKVNNTKYVCGNNHIYWNNPRTAATAVLIRDDKLLYAKRGVAPHEGKYDFPGGFVDFDEDIYQALEREMKEETSVIIQKPIFVFNTRQDYEDNIAVCDFIFVCENWQGTPTPADDVAELEWRPIDFVDSSGFAWKYEGFTDALREYLKSKADNQ